MPNLTVYQGFHQTELQVAAGTPVKEALEKAGIWTPMPCGGRGMCGKCAALMQGELSAPTAQEQLLGSRLICQTSILGEASVTIPHAEAMEQIEAGSTAAVTPCAPLGEGYGAAVDIGTTTLALRLFELETGRCLGVASMANPQIAVAADVIGRIGAAVDGRGETLRSMITSAVETLIVQAAAQADVMPAAVKTLVLTGNTTMLYLLAGRNPEALSHAPFEADHLFDEWIEWHGRKAYLPPCLHAFVGADITCALLASGMCSRSETALLCDVGTNGEIALWKDGVLYIASTAAGPAFEGAGIRCGCSSIPGAIDRVDCASGEIKVSTIGGKPAFGLCGSGLVDAVAALLELEWLDETGAMDDEEVAVAEGVFLAQADVRAVQLAKAAIAAGIECLLHAAGVTEQQVHTVWLAGGFGSHLRLENAAKIGLLPETFISRTKVIGNAALDGAVHTLLRGECVKEMQLVAQKAVHVDLGGNALFNERYVENMFFPEG